MHLSRWHKEMVLSIEVLGFLSAYSGPVLILCNYLSGNVEADIHEEVVKRVQTVQGLPKKEKDLITRTIDGLVRDAKSRHVYAV